MKLTAPPPGPGLTVDWVRLGSHEAHRLFQLEAAEELARRRRVEAALTSATGSVLTATCWICAQPVAFQVAPAGPGSSRAKPEWREELVCPQCHLTNRLRAAIHLFSEIVHPSIDDHVYVTEQASGLYYWFAHNYRNVVGSEYLGDAVPLGLCDHRGIRNEDLIRLTLAPESQDHVLCFDVFEHIPEIGLALAGCYRVLRPGGTLVFTVPFLGRCQRSLRRAEIDPATGEVRHLLEPEFHFDPLHPVGTLAFHSFGWDLLDTIRAQGFAEVDGYLYWSEDYGYLGENLMVFVARKGGEGTAAEAPSGASPGESEREIRLRAGYDEVVARLRGELLRLGATPAEDADVPGAGPVFRSPEELAARRREELTATHLERAHATNAKLTQLLMDERSRLRALEARLDPIPAEAGPARSLRRLLASLRRGQSSRRSP